MGFVFADGVHADHVVQQAVQTGGLHRHAQHGGVAVAQDAGGNAFGFECSQNFLVLRESAQVMVLVHQLLNLPIPLVKLAFKPRGICVTSYFFNSKSEGSTRQFPKRLVVRPVVAGGHQPGVFNLFVAPQHADGLPVAWKKLLCQQAHAVHIEQRAIGVEQHGARFVVDFGQVSGFFHALHCI